VGLWVCGFVAILFTSCNLTETPEKDPNTGKRSLVLDGSFSAYAEIAEGMRSSNEGDETIVLSADTGPDIVEYSLNESMGLSIALELVKQEHLAISHVSVETLDGNLSFSLACYPSWRTTVEDLMALVAEACVGLPTPSVDDLLVTALQVVKYSDAPSRGSRKLGFLGLGKSLRDIPTKELAEKINVSEDANTTRGGSATAYLPDVQNFFVEWIRIGSNSYGDLRWSGTWTDPVTLKTIQDLSRPAIEPAMSLKYDVFGDSPYQGWLKPDPDVNARTVATNMHDHYVDSQVSDLGDRSFCVGSLGLHAFTLGTTYYWQIVQPRWNTSGSSYIKPDPEYEFWSWSSDEPYPPGFGKAWRVGTLPVGHAKDNKYETGYDKLSVPANFTVYR